MARSRDDWQRELRARLRAVGCRDQEGQARRGGTAADPDSLSGKARDYGIPIVSEAELAETLER